MNYIILHFLFINLCLSKSIEIKCPSVCRCDIFESLRRATCYNQNLVTIEADIPKEVQILDMSFNQISHLDDRIFTELKYNELKLLNLSNNKISQIHINAFRNLKQLKTIDFSYNYIQYVLPHWFWETASLVELYLNNNNLMTLGDEQLESESLQTLDISHCHIKDISLKAFNKLPNLKNLYISGNFLTKIDSRFIKPLNKLMSLNLSNNSFVCNDITEFMDYCKSHNIQTYDMCHDPFEEKVEKFQRMINLDNNPTEKNSWIFEDKDDNNEFITEKADTCTQYNATTEESLLLNVFNSYTLIIMSSTFLLGLILGCWFGYNVKKCKIKTKPKRRLSKFRHSLRRKSTHDEHEHGLINYMEDQPNSTPMPQRRNFVI